MFTSGLQCASMTLASRKTILEKVGRSSGDSLHVSRINWNLEETRLWQVFKNSLKETMYVYVCVRVFMWLDYIQQNRNYSRFSWRIIVWDVVYIRVPLMKGSSISCTLNRMTWLGMEFQKNKYIDYWGFITLGVNLTVRWYLCFFLDYKQTNDHLKKTMVLLSANAK